MAGEGKDNEKSAKTGRSPAYRVLKGACVALATVAVVGGILYGLALLRDGVRLAPTYQMSSESLRLVKGPPWMTPGILAELDVALLDPEFPRQFSLLDENVSGRIAAAYERCVWVERVERIVKHDPRVDPKTPPLEVFLKFRRPIAFVQLRDGLYLVDEQGVRLPGVYREPVLGATKLLVVTGVASPAPNVGQGWPDECLWAAVRVAAAVEPKREAFRLTSVDVSNVGGRRDRRDPEIDLYTANDTRIKWGKPPSPEAEMLQEKTPDEKVAYLEFVYKRMNGQVDGVLSYIDIPNEVFRRLPPETVTRLRS